MGNQSVAERVLSASVTVPTPENNGLITLSNGVVLRVLDIGQDAFVEVLSRFKKPEPPLQDTGKGRLEPNVDHPDYKRDVGQYNVELAQAVTLAAYTLGLSVESVPDGYPTHNDEGWLEEMRLAHLLYGESDRARLLTWLRFKACKNSSDNKAVMRAIGRRVGTAEGDVADAMKSASNH